jgi:uncharacterized protein YdeI (YjbR/CyaY-like superfamily)
MFRPNRIQEYTGVRESSRPIARAVVDLFHLPIVLSMPENSGAMGTRNPRTDEYIAKAAPFAQPILRHIRELVHEGCPEVIEEIKWSMPVFTYKGMLCNMAAFKEHCAFGFWKAKLVLGEQEKNAMGNFGRLTSVKDLPSKKEMLGYIKEARRLNDEGVKVAKLKKSSEKKELVVPPYFLAAVKKNKKALGTFDAFPYSHKKEYVEWVTEAKTDETRQRRLATTVEWLAEGKSRNWKYERC